MGESREQVGRILQKFKTQVKPTWNKIVTVEVVTDGYILMV